MDVELDTLILESFVNAHVLTVLNCLNVWVYITSNTDRY